MTEPEIIQQQKAILPELLQLIDTRAAKEAELLNQNRVNSEKIEESYTAARENINQEVSNDRAALERDFLNQRNQYIEKANEELEEATVQYETDSAKAIETYEEKTLTTKKAHQDATWNVKSIYDTERDGPGIRYEEYQAQLATVRQHLDQDFTRAQHYFKECHLGKIVEEYTEVPAPEMQGIEDPTAHLQSAVDSLNASVNGFEKLKSPWLFGNSRFVFVPVGLGAAAFIAAGFGTDWDDLGFLAGSGLVAAVIGMVILFIVYKQAQAQGNEAYLKMSVTFHHGVIAHDLALQHAMVHRTNEEHAIVARREQGQAEVDQQFALQYEQLEQEQAATVSEITATYEKQQSAIEANKTDFLNNLHENSEKRRAEVDAWLADQTAAVDSAYETDKKGEAERHRKLWEELCGLWQTGLMQIHSSVTGLNHTVQQFCPNWESNAWQKGFVAKQVPPALRLGQFDFRFADIPNAVPQDEQLCSLLIPDFSLPGIVTIPGDKNLLIRTRAKGRESSSNLLQLAMLRLVTSIPPGKVRFSIIDPVGLGENFAAFMHLADYEESLVTSRIWTESKQIDQRLLDLSEQMENVIQKRLRNEFNTIAEYNEQAGEIAEPYHFLVIANFPANFSEETARRLMSIAQSGPRCGVHILMSVDTKQPMPKGFDLKELQRYCSTIIWRDDHFVLHDEEFAGMPFNVDSLPETERYTEILNHVGLKAKEAKRVEVPFDTVAPTDESEWWKESCSNELTVPLGRAGANRLQAMKLGLGTSQHVLVAGKTGSGKSTMLHALITNTALRYSPDEVQFYLIDFKKGVEFKMYAAQKLPHARVIAVESEREFGLSVLQRIDVELKARGELFREKQVNDLKGYRNATGEVLPRLLLIIDEFQELFVEDDRISQECSLLLDRIVRQGRAFGIHAIMGSQTLAGSFSLPRSTLGQMAVRVALQCSESDAHLILSDENTAARFLSRPGEGIYNDANGLAEGNNFFQVVWLGEDQREDYLQRLCALSEKTTTEPVPPAIVFEGNVPAKLEANFKLNQWLAADEWMELPKAQTAYLGDAIAIKDPTAAVFRPQSANHLLMVGQRPEPAMGILSASLISLAAQLPPSTQNDSAVPSIFVLDGSPVDAEHHGQLGEIAKRLPVSSMVGGFRDVPDVMNTLHQEFNRRQDTGDTEGAPIFLFVNELQRLRDLRKKEDDFSFSSSSSDEPPKPDKIFGTLLKEGSAFGIHIILWVDTMNNMNRSLERQALREFDQRILFQMNSTDSSNLIDSPVASKLGLHRALFYSEENGILEKFRPYEIPHQELLDKIQSQLAKRPTASNTSGS